ncbi:MAG TPA: hypothetical protein VKB05_08825 [Pyrinomonadaceae bacterium]|nr:hypothetical protein [Pyrinomonadaceae bacterium]
MKHRRTLQSLIIFGCLLFLTLWPLGGAAQQKMRIDRRTIRPNLIAPELYSDKLSLKITLMNLPGAATSASHWEVEFQLFFVPEQDFEKTMKELNKAGKGRELRPEYFPSKILLATGKFNKQRLDTLKQRVFLRQGISFRDKVPPELQTSFSSLMSFYSVKVFDGKLKKDIYGSDVFIVPPFETDTNDRNSLAARTDLFLNFFVADDGSLFRSNTKSASETTEWKPN